MSSLFSGARSLSFTEAEDLHFSIVYANVKSPLLTAPDLRRITGKYKTPTETWVRVEDQLGFEKAVENISAVSPQLSSTVTISSDMLRSKEAFRAVIDSSLKISLIEWVLVVILASASTSLFLLPSLKEKREILTLHYILGQDAKSLAHNFSRLLTLRSCRWIITSYLLGAGFGFLVSWFFTPFVFKEHSPSMPWTTIATMLIVHLLTVILAYSQATSSFLRNSPSFFSPVLFSKREFI